MNKTEQKKVSKILSRLQGMQAEFEALVAAMGEKISNRSERYTESEKGQDEQHEFSTLQDALNSIENAIDYLDNIDLSEVQ